MTVQTLERSSPNDELLLLVLRTLASNKHDGRPWWLDAARVGMMHVVVISTSELNWGNILVQFVLTLIVTLLCSVCVIELYQATRMKKTIYVSSCNSHDAITSRKKKGIMKKSGAEVNVESSSVGGNVPVHLKGSRKSVGKAILLVQEAVGSRLVGWKINDEPYNPPQMETPAPPGVTSPPRSPNQDGVASTDSNGSSNSDITTTLEENQNVSIDTDNGSIDEEDDPNSNDATQRKTANDLDEEEISDDGEQSAPAALATTTEPSTSLGSPTMIEAVPSEIGIDSYQAMTRETITEASISSLANFTLNENDPLLVFLQSQHQCIKGSVDEFYIWLVKSEDIDSMLALKEAVCDDNYLNDTMKVGNGSSGLKGFKRKAFQTAVLEHEDTTTIISDEAHSMSQPESKTMANSVSMDPPEDLVCPISLILMTNDPVVALPYIRAFIYRRLVRKEQCKDWHCSRELEG